VISAETMTLHHTKHHNAYITNLNIAIEKMDAAMTSSDVSAIIALQGALKFNGGGHLNHTLFWENLTPEKTCPTGPLGDAIIASFGSFDKMKEEMIAKSIAVQGSGWGWLGYNSSSGTLKFSLFEFMFYTKANFLLMLLCFDRSPGSCNMCQSRSIAGYYRVDSIDGN
jgi:superoxide dismutase, Fe-Mn family